MSTYPVAPSCQLSRRLFRGPFIQIQAFIDCVPDFSTTLSCSLPLSHQKPYQSKDPFSSLKLSYLRSSSTLYESGCLRRLPVNTRAWTRCKCRSSETSSQTTCRQEPQRNTSSEEPSICSIVYLALQTFLYRCKKISQHSYSGV